MAPRPFYFGGVDYIFMFGPFFEVGRREAVHRGLLFKRETVGRVDVHGFVEHDTLGIGVLTGKTGVAGIGRLRAGSVVCGR